jgi:Cu(I)/Ag(I) efflux system periplasmic protein CusF
MKAIHILAATALAALASLSTPAQTVATDKPPMADGEVRKVDKEQGKLTLRHGPIQNLDMPGMTMVFQVKDPALLDKVKAGDKVRFKAEKANAAMVVTDIQPAN